ncbi:MAG TPA: transcription termination/antitermination NusG family protein [Ferruginibacter sp.]|nr:transcription termination/antitermination NusG family protein [Ferruginibacter sp.]
MERNWYVICTTKKKEKKVVSILNKKGIENYCPFTIREIKNVSRSMKEYGPMFTSFVFVKVEAVELSKLTRLPYIVNSLYWRSSPAVISADEINAIKMMEENYNCIAIENTGVNTTEKVSIVERNITGYSNNVVSVKHQGITVKLPTLGYSLTADRIKEKQSPVIFKKKTALQAITQSINSFFY